MPSLSDASRLSLLGLARRAVVDAVTRGQLPEQTPNDGVFAERRGVFVTLHVHRCLRGCIGVVETDEPLGEAIVRSAASAALHDPRFPPLRSEELTGLRADIDSGEFTARNAVTQPFCAKSS